MKLINIKNQKVVKDIKDEHTASLYLATNEWKKIEEDFTKKSQKEENSYKNQ